ncbi:hypothetical protein [Catenulispora subtropica]|uniref:TubC N-terminal docking domain-containing protein n=1 Tax=Catenulispora subtropica TaxID=450798 RepID=A0ABN2QIW7_9ACTN
MANHIPTSIAFLSAARPARVSRASVDRSRSRWPDEEAGSRLVRMNPPAQYPIELAQLADGRALVRAGTSIDVGYEVYLPNPAEPGFLRDPRTVAAIDRSTRSGAQEWLLTWAGEQPVEPADAEISVDLDPAWFAEPLVRWIHETSGGNAVDLAGFAPGDVTLESVTTLAEHLSEQGLLTIAATATGVTATLTENGRAEAEQAAIARADRHQREEALRQGMITFLAEYERSSRTPDDWKPFLLDPRSMFHGDFFTVDELAREAQYLAEMGLIRSFSQTNGMDRGWTMPQLTARGRNCNDYHGGNVADSLKPEPQPGPTINVTGSPGAQVNTGNNSQQNSTAPAAHAPESLSRRRKVWEFFSSLVGVITGIGILVLTAVLVYMTEVLIKQK